MSVDDLLDVDIAAAADVKWNPVHSSRHRCGCGQATTKRLGRQGVETAAACHCERALEAGWADPDLDSPRHHIFGLQVCQVPEQLESLGPAAYSCNSGRACPTRRL